MMAPQAAAMADLFGAKPADTDFIAELMAELRSEARHREYHYPKRVDDGAMTKDQAERRIILILKALALVEAVGDYLTDRSALVDAVARKLAGPRPGGPTKLERAAASGILDVIEERLRLGNFRLTTPSASQRGRRRHV